MNTLDITLKKNNKPIFSWCPSLEEGALQQIKAIAELPFVEHLALMPDAHLGMEMPIGGVVGCSSVIVPNFVGVDIGCGMAAIKTNIVVSDIQSKEEIIHHAVERSIPMGFSHNTDERRKRMEQKYSDKIDYVLDKNLIDNLHNIVDRKSFFEQMGSLGGGNHFIEVQYDENDNVWIMLHSGSRNIGKKICDYFNNMAKDINSLWYSNSPIGFLPVTTDVGKAYIGWMNIALKFGIT
jgi:tRNA-splicing ligase RtcB